MKYVLKDKFLFSKYRQLLFMMDLCVIIDKKNLLVIISAPGKDCFCPYSLLETCFMSLCLTIEKDR